MQGRTQTLLSVQSIRDKTTLRVNNGLNSKKGKREEHFFRHSDIQTFHCRDKDDG